MSFLTLSELLLCVCAVCVYSTPIQFIFIVPFGPPGSVNSAKRKEEDTERENWRKGEKERRAAK